MTSLSDLPSKNGKARRNLPVLDPVGADREVFNEYLRESDPCFGKHYAKTPEECRNCTAPVILDGELYLLREICKGISAGGSGPARLNKLSSRDVLERIQEGVPVTEIFLEILGDASPAAAATDARQVLYNRLYYLEKEKGLPMPDLPRTQEMLP